MMLSEYTYQFDSINDNFNNVVVYDQHNRQHNIEVMVNEKDVHQKLLHLSSIASDLIDLAVAIYVADRLSTQEKDFSSIIHIKLGLRFPERFNDPQTLKLLEKTLFWYTEDHWHFEFFKRKGYLRVAEKQPYLPLHNNHFELNEFALWSGGLDSFAGLITQLLNRPHKHITLIGTGSNTMIFKTQKYMAAKLRQLYPGQITYAKLPYQLKASCFPYKNKICRTRGLVFQLIGSACVISQNQSTLHIYENGIGAINLPYLKSGVGLDHARSVHPKSLSLIGKFVSKIIDRKFSCNNPFILWTKAQMVRSLNSSDFIDLIPQTSSCDSPVRVLNTGVKQCGKCSSCILRRQSLAASKIEDNTHYLFKNIWQLNNPPLHLKAMCQQIKTFRSILDSPKLWIEFSREFPEIDDVVNQLASQGNTQRTILENDLIQLYESHVSEWDTFKSNSKTSGKSMEEEILTIA